MTRRQRRDYHKALREREEREYLEEVMSRMPQFKRMLVRMRFRPLDGGAQVFIVGNYDELCARIAEIARILCPPR